MDMRRMDCHSVNRRKMMFELHSKKREAASKSAAKNLRRLGLIPAVIYKRGKEAEAISVPNEVFVALLRNVLPGRLPTTVFTLIDEKGVKRSVIIKDIQYKITNYQVIHLDFEELLDNVPVNVKVPIECVGVADCVGIKLGGVLRQVIRHLRVSCLPKDIPAFFEVDVKELGLRAVKRLKDLTIPQTVRPLARLDEVAVAIVKR